MQPIPFQYSNSSVITINTLEELLSLVPVYDEATNSRNLQLMDEDLQSFEYIPYHDFSSAEVDVFEDLPW